MFGKAERLLIPMRSEQMATDTELDERPGLDAAFFTEILESNKSKVRDAVRDSLLEGVKREFQWELPQAVRKVVNDFIAEEIVPEIKAELETNKKAFVEAATEIVKGATGEIGKALQDHLAKNLSQSWTMRKLVEALFQ